MEVNRIRHSQRSSQFFPRLAHGAVAVDMKLGSGKALSYAWQGADGHVQPLVDLQAAGEEQQGPAGPVAGSAQLRPKNLQIHVVHEHGTTPGHASSLLIKGAPQVVTDDDVICRPRRPAFDPEQETEPRRVNG